MLGELDWRTALRISREMQSQPIGQKATTLFSCHMYGAQLEQTTL